MRGASPGDSQQPVAKPRVAPRSVLRLADKARRGSIDAAPFECSGAFATGCQGRAPL